MKRKPMKIETFLISAIALTGLVACTSTDTDDRDPVGIAAYMDDPRLGEKVDKICFARNIDGFNALDSRTLILSDSPKKKYIVETYGPCNDIDYAWEIALDSFSSCLRDNDKLIITRGSGVQGRDPLTRTCHIKSIYKWNPKAAEAEVEAETTATD